MTRFAAVDSVEVAELQTCATAKGKAGLLIGERLLIEANPSRVLSNVKHIHSNRGFKINISRGLLQTLLHAITPTRTTSATPYLCFKLFKG